MNERRAASLGEGVYYSPQAYAGLALRFLILAIDFAVLVAAAAVAYGIDMLSPFESSALVLIWCWVLFAYVYLVFLESSAIGTLGFFLTGMKIVNLRGDRPSFVRMTFRLLLWVLGPFNPVIDLIWLGNDANRQTLRDKLSGTYVVKKSALPCGRGPVRLAHYFLMGFSVLFPEVQKKPA